MSSSEMKESKPVDVHNEHAAFPARGARFADPDGGERPLAPSTTVDTEKGTNSTYANSETGLQLREDRAKAERKLLWKFGEFRKGRGGRAGLRAGAPLGLVGGHRGPEC